MALLYCFDIKTRDIDSFCFLGLLSLLSDLIKAFVSETSLYKRTKAREEIITMWPTLLILSIFALLTFDATAAQDPFEQEVTLNVNDQETFSYKIKKRELGTDGTKIVITSRLEQGQNVNMVVLYGRQSESWILNSLDDNTTTTLCHEDEASNNFDTLHFTLHSYDGKRSVVKLSAKWQDISLKLKQSRKTLVSGVIFNC